MQPDRSTKVSSGYPYQKWWFWGLLLANLVFKIIMIATTKRYLMNDEAAVGMMALAIDESHEIPFYPTFDARGGGHVVEALMSVIGFKLFGISDFVVTSVPALLSCLIIAMVYATLYRYFGKKLALSAAAFLSISTSFVFHNFYVNGAMTAMLAAWIGFHCFCGFYFERARKLFYLAAAGIWYGFSYYCFEYSLLYLIVSLALWFLRDGIGIVDRWRQGLVLIAGLLIGAAPTLYFNFTNSFLNFKLVYGSAGDASSPVVLRFFSNVTRLASRDLPAFFGYDIYDFPDRIHPLAYAAYALLLVGSAGLLLTRMSALLRLLTAGFGPNRYVPKGDDRAVIFILFILGYAGMYCLAPVSGLAPRYLLPFYPFLAIVFAGGVIELYRRQPLLGLGTGVLFTTVQLFFNYQFALDPTIQEWKIKTHGASIKQVKQFLVSNNYTTVMTPYDLKWKLMFESKGRIVCASYMFGYDTDRDYNVEVYDRVNRRHSSLVALFHKDFLFTKIMLRIDPEKAFELDEFHAYLKSDGISYEVTPVGKDYIVYHKFSKQLYLRDPP